MAIFEFRKFVQVFDISRGKKHFISKSVFFVFFMVGGGSVERVLRESRKTTERQTKDRQKTAKRLLRDY